MVTHPTMGLIWIYIPTLMDRWPSKHYGYIYISFNMSFILQGFDHGTHEFPSDPCTYFWTLTCWRAILVCSTPPRPGKATSCTRRPFPQRWALASLWKPWPTDGLRLSHRLYPLPATFTWGLFESQPLLVKQGMVLRQGFMYLGNCWYQILVPDVPSNNQHQKICIFVWFEEF